MARRLASMLREDDPWLKGYAVGWLGALGTSAGRDVPGLIEVAGSETPELRLAATEALGRILTDGQLCMPVLVGLLQDPDSHVREMAIWSLWQFASETDADMSAAIQALTLALQDQTASRRVVTALALSWILPTPKSVIPFFSDLLENGEPYDRYTCLFALADIVDRSPDALMLLVGALGDSDSLIRESALHLLYQNRIGQVVPIPDSGRPQLEALVESADERVRQWADAMLALPRRSR